MARVFAVMRSQGPAWRDSLPLEHQEDWAAHAEFMNNLHQEGFVLLGGPLEGTRDVLLIVTANDESQIRSPLAVDCWTVKNLLITRQIQPWTLRLGSLA